MKYYSALTPFLFKILPNWLSPANMGAVPVRWAVLPNNIELNSIFVTTGLQFCKSPNAFSAETTPLLGFCESLVGVSAVLGVKILFSLLSLTE